MSGTWSGAIIYEWIEEANNYGLIEYGPPVDATVTGANVAGGFTIRGTPTPIQPGFDNLKSQWAAASPSGVKSAAYSPSLSAPACPSTTAGAWLAAGPLPTLGQEYNAAAGGSASTTATGASGSRATTNASGSVTGASSGTTSSSAAATKMAIGGPALLAVLGAGLL